MEGQLQDLLPHWEAIRIAPTVVPGKGRSGSVAMGFGSVDSGMAERLVVVGQTD